jgi:hypothetical protein
MYYYVFVIISVVCAVLCCVIVKMGIKINTQETIFTFKTLYETMNVCLNSFNAEDLEGQPFYQIFWVVVGLEWSPTPLSAKVRTNFVNKWWSLGRNSSLAD